MNRRRKSLKASRLTGPRRPGYAAQRRNPLLPELRDLRAQLRDHANKLPPEISAMLDWLIDWAGWVVDRPWTPQQIQYQRYCLVREGYRLAELKGLKNGLGKFARDHAMKALAGSPAACADEMMRKSYEAERDAIFE